MKNPSPILRGLFICGVGALLVSVQFSIVGWPAADIFSCLGGISTLVFYFLFDRVAVVKRKSRFPRHVTVVALITAIVLKSFEIAIGSWFFLIAFMAFLVWLAWSVLEELPPSSD
ncbi:MAG: hypothetical protein GC178_05510 [Flavobacteriales bacterium]|nr:hypothetical protein [Flavobacteriales bacterium]